MTSSILIQGETKSGTPIIYSDNREFFQGFVGNESVVFKIGETTENKEHRKYFIKSKLDPFSYVTATFENSYAEGKVVVCNDRYVMTGSCVRGVWHGKVFLSDFIGGKYVSTYENGVCKETVRIQGCYKCDEVCGKCVVL